MENKDFKCLHRRKGKVSETVFLRRSQNLFPHLSYPSIHLPVVEHLSGEPTTIWSRTIIRVWMQEEKMLWIPASLSLGYLPAAQRIKPQTSLTLIGPVLLGKANFLISAPHSRATWLTACGAHRSPLWRENGRGSWSFEHGSCKLSTGK